MLKQAQNSPIPVEEQVAIIYSGINGFIDDISVEKVKTFAQELREYLRVSKPEYAEAIKATQKFDESTENILKDAIAFVKERMADMS